MFAYSVFDKPIEDWELSSLTILEGMFKNSQYNQPLNNWCKDNSHNTMGRLSSLHVRNFNHMFENSEFNQPLDNWRFELNQCNDLYVWRN